MRKPIIIGVIGNKGGIGKTTTAVSIAYALERFHGKKVLLVEGDGQGSCSKHIGFNKRTSSNRGMSNVLKGDNLEDCIIKQDNAPDFLPGGLENESIIQEINNEDKGQAPAIMKDAFVESSYDVVIVDSPPSNGILITFIMSLSTHIIIPFSPNDPESTENLKVIISWVKQQKEYAGDSPEIMGVVATIVRRNTAMVREFFPTIRDVFRKRGQYLGMCPIDAKLPEAVAMGMPIYDYKAKSKGAEFYKEITNVVNDKITLIQEGRG